MAFAKWLTLRVLLCGLVFAPSTAPADEAARLVFLGFDLINTSLEPTSNAEEQRLRMLDDQFRDSVSASKQYQVVAIPADLQRSIAAATEIRNCNGCERDFAHRADAGLAAWGTVQKVSNLILNINLYVEDAGTGRMVFVKSVDIRGNTDESWRHGLSYLLRHYFLKMP